ncbi:MAG: hypothetical protein J7J86_01785 [Bacteroidales bacterium]|nr:hypothetical protein [Bacteroidales bacterium]
MKKTALILFTLLLIFGCEKDETGYKHHTMEPYLKSLLAQGAPCDDNYFISLNRNGEDIFLSEGQTNVNTGYSYSSGLGMTGQGYFFKDTLTDETYEINFYINDCTDSTIVTADYYYADPWSNRQGANVEYYVPVGNPDNPDSYYLYLGSDKTSSYFKITYIDENRLCGSFKTIWRECCGGDKTFNVEGEFSIPKIKFRKE